jgi:hypothetical protein
MFGLTPVTGHLIIQDTPTCRPEIVKEIAGGFVRLGEKATEVLRRLKERPGFSGALVEALPSGSKDRDLDAIARAIFDDYSAKKQRMPGSVTGPTPGPWQSPPLERIGWRPTR